MSYNQSPVLGLAAPMHGMYQHPHPTTYSAPAPAPAEGGPSKKRKTAKSTQDVQAGEWANTDAAHPPVNSGSASGSGSGTSSANGAATSTRPKKKDKADVKKRSQSCDVCRARKVKCVKPAGADACEGCKDLGQTCEYTHERRKPGPANGFARRTSGNQPPPPPTEMNTASTQHVRGHSQAPESLIIIQHEPHHNRSHSHGALPSFHMPPPPIPWSPTAASLLFDNAIAPSFDLQSSQITSTDFPDSSFLPISPQSLMHPQPGEQDSASEGTPTGRWSWIPGLDDLWDAKAADAWMDPSLVGADDGSGALSSGMTLPFVNSEQGQSASSNPPSTSSHSGFMLAAPAAPPPNLSAELARNSEISSSVFNRDHMPPVPSRSQVEQATKVLGKVARLEDVAPLSTITRILQGYYAHLYALMPVVHWPSFLQQLIAREDERSEPWRAFVLSLVAYSIIQLPRSVLAFLPVRDLRRLHQRCHAESRKLQNREYTEVRLIQISTLYCDHIYLGTLGRTHIANVILAEAIRLAQTINLHDERIGDHVSNVIERETRRRVFWLLYGSDRTITALTSAPMHIQDCDLFLPLPLSIDDALLTAAGAFPQPRDITPLLAGFHFNCRIFRLLGAVITAHRNLLAASGHPSDPILQLPPIHAPVRPSRDFMEELNRMIQDLPGPLQLVNPTTTPPSNGDDNTGGVSPADKDSSFATCRANLLISQAMVRFAIRQYARAAGEMETESGGRDWAERDVLHLLESMSSESLAANGESLRRKVLFVASSLLEKYPSSAEGHSYVADFLAVYTRISEEQHVALLEMSAAPSREQSPMRRLSAVISG